MQISWEKQTSILRPVCVCGVCEHLWWLDSATASQPQFTFNKNDASSDYSSGLIQLTFLTSTLHFGCILRQAQLPWMSTSLLFHNSGESNDKHYSRDGERPGVWKQTDGIIWVGRISVCVCVREWDTEGYQVQSSSVSIWALRRHTGTYCPGETFSLNQLYGSVLVLWDKFHKSQNAYCSGAVYFFPPTLSPSWLRET